MASNIKDNEELNDFLLVRSANEEEEVFYDVETFGGISDDNTGPGDDSQTVVLSEKEHKLHSKFILQLKKLEDGQKLSVDTERKRLGKVKPGVVFLIEVNNVLQFYFNSVEVERLENLVDVVYAMGEVVMQEMGVKEREVGKKGNLQNRQVRKKVDRIKFLRQWIARIANEIHRRRLNRKMTLKEKVLMNEFRTIFDIKVVKNEDLFLVKEKLLDELRYQQVSLRKIEERGKKKRDNKCFLNNETQFYRGFKTDTGKEGEAPGMDEFVEFWGDIWEDETKTPMKPWMAEVGQELFDRVHSFGEFKVSYEEMIRQLKKRKNWTAPGINGIQNFWWKNFSAT